MPSELLETNLEFFKKWSGAKISREEIGTNARSVSEANIAELVAEYLKVPEQSQCLIFLGVGPHIPAIVGLRTKPIRTVILVEANKEAMLSEMTRTNFTCLNKAKHILCVLGKAPAPAVVATASQFADMNVGCSYDLISLPEATEEAPEYYSGFWDTIESVKFQADAGFCSDIIQTQLYATNIFANLKRILSLPGIRSSFNTGRDRHGVALGAGPSLSKQYDLIPEAYNRGAIIVAPLGTAEPLRKAKLLKYIHTFCAIDPREAQLGYIQPGLESIPLVVEWKTHPKIVNLPGVFAVGKAVDSLADWCEEKAGRDFGHWVCGENIIHSEWDLLRSLGCIDCTLIGCDLAYDQAWHVAGVVEWNKEPIEKGRTKEVVAWGGKGVVSTGVGFERAIITFMRMIGEHDFCTFNCTEGGARIPLTLETSFKTIVDGWIKTKEPYVFPKTEIREDPVDREGVILDVVKHFCRETIHLANKGIEDCERFIKMDRLTVAAKRLANRATQAKIDIEGLDGCMAFRRWQNTDWAKRHGLERIYDVGDTPKQKMVTTREYLETYRDVAKKVSEIVEDHCDKSS